MGTPIEERVFEYARGASAAGQEQTSVVVRQVIDLAHGDIEILHRACWYCEQNLCGKHPDSQEGEQVLALLHAAVATASRKTVSATGSGQDERSTVLSPEVVVELAIDLAKKNLDVPVAEKELLAAAHDDLGVIETARTLALRKFAAGLAAGETSTITALSILEGACRRGHD